jgi:hypothetical protein
MYMCEQDGQRARARAMLTISFASTSAPFASSASTSFAQPFREASCNVVLPSCGAGEHCGQQFSQKALQPAHTSTCLNISIDRMADSDWVAKAILQI